MLDIRFIRENPELVAKKAEQKGYEVDIQHLLKLDEKRRNLLAKAEELRAKRNELNDKQAGKPSEQQMIEGKALRQELHSLEVELEPVEVGYQESLKVVPNIFPDDTPIGDEKANREEKKWGDTAEADFEVKNHLEWAEGRGLVDFERGAKVAGNKFYYLKSSLVELELALAQFGLHQVKKYNF